ncbi:hypothetical protein BDN70DRAFT_940095, partial [Pholiota conissans]
MEEYGIAKPNWSIPRILPDDEIYMAFRPRIIRHSGDLFGRLNLTRDALAKAIVTVSGGYGLDYVLLYSWLRLENALLDICDSLPPKGIPVISYPKFPYEYGYRQCHKSRDAALRCAIRSRDAFVDLSSVVSMIIALNMDDDGSYEKAFYKLTSRRHNPVHAAWLDLLKMSSVCNFVENFRVGVVVSPYTCHWGPFLYKFALARVPIWIFWGHHYKSTPPVDNILSYFLPPDEWIARAMDITRKSGDYILPTLRFEPLPESAVYGSVSPTNETHDDYRPGSPMRLSPPPTDAVVSSAGDDLSSSASVQTWVAQKSFAEPELPETFMTDSDKAKAIAALEEFFTKAREEVERRIALETYKDRQSRLGREA